MKARKAAIPSDIRLRRRHFIERSCLSKRRYTTRETAELYLRHFVTIADDPDKLHPYGPCRFCGGFHFGHSRGERDAREQDQWKS